jgi:hypothetical protein
VDEQLVKEFIEHHGVKGMRWGVRKSGGLGKSSADFKKVAALKKKPKHQLTNQQLKTINERLNLETNFSKMNPGPVKKGAETAAGILATVGIGFTAYNMVKSPAGQAFISTGKKVLGKLKIKHGIMEVGVDSIKHGNSLLLRTIS